MKKTFIGLMAISAITLTSCSNDDVLSAPEDKAAPITFDGFVNKNSRGVTDITIANMGSFAVYGYQSPSDNATGVVTRFNDVTVNVAADGTATYNPVQYWTLNNYYWFCGWASNNTNVVSFTPSGDSTWPGASNSVWGGSFTFNNGVDAYNGLTGAAGDADLVFAYAKTGEVTTPANVSMDFKHLLSKVAFKFTNSMPYSNIRVYGLTVKQVDPIGTINLCDDAPAWTRESGAGVTKFNMNYDGSTSDMNGLQVANGISKGTSVTTKYNIFIPGTFNYLISFKIDQVQDGVVLATYTHNVNLSTPVSMEMGNAYVFTADVNTDNIDPTGALQPIVFATTVTTWVENTPTLM